MPLSAGSAQLTHAFKNNSVDTPPKQNSMHVQNVQHTRAMYSFVGSTGALATRRGFFVTRGFPI